MKDFKESENGLLRFICLSQPILKDEILNAFATHFQMPCIRITKEKNLKDIATYVSWTVDQSPKLKRALGDHEFRQETVTKLSQCTEGVFESLSSSYNDDLKVTNCIKWVLCSSSS